jgi:NAD(P) transhydrogenase
VFCLTLTRRSVTVDLAAEAGGNVETTEPGKVVRTKNGVTCIGYTDLPGRCAAQSSTLFGNNVSNFILSMGDAKEGRFEIRHDDEAVRGALVTQDFQTMFPPPAPKPKQMKPSSVNNIISSGSKAGGSENADDKTLEDASEETASKGPPAWLGDAKSATIFGTFLALMCVIGAAGPPAEAIGIVSAFSLACIVGYFAVTGVTGESSFYLFSTNNNGRFD